MALTKTQKQGRIDYLQNELKSASTVVLAQFSGLTVEQDLELRRALRQAGAKYRVIKNTLAQRAAQGTDAALVLKDLKGVNAIAYTGGDGVALAKTLHKFAKDNPGLVIQAGMAEGSRLSAADVEQFAAMPSREEMFSRLLFLIQAPAQRLVTALSAVGRNTAVVLDQAVQAKKFAE